MTLHTACHDAEDVRPVAPAPQQLVAAPRQHSAAPVDRPRNAPPQAGLRVRLCARLNEVAHGGCGAPSWTGVAKHDEGVGFGRSSAPALGNVCTGPQCGAADAAHGLPLRRAPSAEALRRGRPPGEARPPERHSADICSCLVPHALSSVACRRAALADHASNLHWRFFRSQGRKRLMGEHLQPGAGLAAVARARERRSVLSEWSGANQQDASSAPNELSDDDHSKSLSASDALQHECSYVLQMVCGTPRADPDNNEQSMSDSLTQYCSMDNPFDEFEWQRNTMELMHDTSANGVQPILAMSDAGLLEMLGVTAMISCESSAKDPDDSPAMSMSGVSMMCVSSSPNDKTALSVSKDSIGSDTMLRNLQCTSKHNQWALWTPDCEHDTTWGALLNHPSSPHALPARHLQPHSELRLPSALHAARAEDLGWLHVEPRTISLNLGLPSLAATCSPRCTASPPHSAAAVPAAQQIGFAPRTNSHTAPTAHTPLPTAHTPLPGAACRDSAQQERTATYAQLPRDAGQDSSDGHATRAARAQELRAAHPHGSDEQERTAPGGQRQQLGAARSGSVGDDAARVALHGLECGREEDARAATHERVLRAARVSDERKRATTVAQRPDAERRGSSDHDTLRAAPGALLSAARGSDARAARAAVQTHAAAAAAAAAAAGSSAAEPRRPPCVTASERRGSDGLAAAQPRTVDMPLGPGHADWACAACSVTEGTGGGCAARPCTRRSGARDDAHACNTHATSSGRAPRCATVAALNDLIDVAACGAARHKGGACSEARGTLSDEMAARLAAAEDALAELQRSGTLQAELQRSGTLQAEGGARDEDISVSADRERWAMAEAALRSRTSNQVAACRQSTSTLACDSSHSHAPERNSSSGDSSHALEPHLHTVQSSTDADALFIELHVSDSAHDTSGQRGSPAASVPAHTQARTSMVTHADKHVNASHASASSVSRDRVGTSDRTRSKVASGSATVGCSCTIM